MKSTTIRKARLSDAEQLGHVHYHAWLETYKGKINDKYLNELSVSRSVKMFKRIECKNHYVLEINNKIVGFVGYSKVRDNDLVNCGEIPGIYILKKYHGLGYGMKLMDQAIKELKDKGYDKVSLWVLDTNENAITFYKKYGFNCDGKEKVETLIDPIRELRYLYNIESSSSSI